jgi:sirohydrochlorin cobaltochelatase
MELPRNTEAVLVTSSGSSVEAANNTLRAMTGRLARDAGDVAVEAAFAGLAEPGLSDQLAKLYARGVRRMALLPYLLFPGKLLQMLEVQVHAFIQHHAGVDICLAPTLGAHPAIMDLIELRLCEARENR